MASIVVSSNAPMAQNTATSQPSTHPAEGEWSKTTPYTEPPQKQQNPTSSPASDTFTRTTPATPSPYIDTPEQQEPLLLAPAAQDPNSDFYTKNKLSKDPMPLNIFWGKRPRLIYSPTARMRVGEPSAAEKYLHERLSRLTLARDDGKAIATTNTSFQYALRQIKMQPTLKGKVFTAETLVNQFRYFSEPIIKKDNKWVSEDHWMTPSEFLNPKYGGFSGGDCEDFAIYKYTLLEQAGVSPEKMKIVGLKIPSPSGVIGHAVLTVEDTEQGFMYVLDNLAKPKQTPLHYNISYVPRFYITFQKIAEF